MRHLSCLLAFILLLEGPSGAQAQVSRKDINTLKATDKVIVSYLKAVETFEFYDEKKMKVTIAIKDLLDTTKLGYIYNHPPGKEEKDGVTTKDKNQRTVAHKEFENRVALEKKPVAVSLKMNPEETKNFARLLEKEIPQFSLRLALDEVTFGDLADPDHKKMVNADSWIEVFVNAPADAKLGSKSPYYVGNFSFFGPVQKKRSVANISAGIEKMRKADRFRDVKTPDEIQVTLVRVWSDAPPADVGIPLTFKKISLLVLE